MEKSCLQRYAPVVPTDELGWYPWEEVNIQATTATATTKSTTVPFTDVDVNGAIQMHTYFGHQRQDVTHPVQMQTLIL